VTKQRVLTRIVAPLMLVGAAGLASAGIVHAYPPASLTAKETAGCPQMNQGTTCVFTFQFIDQNGNGVSGLPITFTISGVPGTSVSPTTGTTDPGFVSTTVKASTTNTGLATVTASTSGPKGTASASGTTQIVALPNTGNGNGNGNGGTGLPNTSTGAPGTNPLAYLGIGLALMLLLAGAFTLRQTRKAS
jgi:hypothetical protein